MFSQSFQNLKQIKERLKNYNSRQLIDTHDNIIMRYISPIIENTDYIDIYFAELIAWLAGGRNRKISREPTNTLLLRLALFLIETDKKRKILLFKKCKLERSIPHYITSDFLEDSNSYIKIMTNLTKEKDILKRSLLLEKKGFIEQRCSAFGNLWTAYLAVRFWHNESIQFKNMLIEKYMRHIVNKAGKYYRAKSHRLDLDDIIQNFSLAASKAIDKFDSRKGTLTSYIELWMRQAESYSFDSHEYGIAFSIPSNKKKGAALDSKNVNIYVPLEEKEIGTISTEEDVEEHVERLDEIDKIRELAKYADPIGIARIELGIQEILSNKELTQLKENCL